MLVRGEDGDNYKLPMVEDRESTLTAYMKQKEHDKLEEEIKKVQAELQALPSVTPLRNPKLFLGRPPKEHKLVKVTLCLCVGFSLCVDSGCIMDLR